MAAREALSAVDAAWLRMDRPTNLMMICGMLVLDGPVPLAGLRALVRTRMLCFHRFGQRVVQAPGGPYWERDPAFDLDWHVRRMALPAGPQALQELVGDLASTALDPFKPMWQFHLIEGAGTSALVLRIHHCYGDGFALLHLLDALTDADPEQPRPAPEDVGPAAPARSAWERVLGDPSAVAGDAVRALEAAAGAGMDLLTGRGAALGAARGGLDVLVQAGVIANMAPDAPTRLKGALGVMKRVAWAAPLALDEVKAVAQVLGGSVNDVLVACCAGALDAWLQHQGDAVAGQVVRALVPVNLRPPGRLADLGNHFGLVFLDLPLGLGEPVACAQEVHRRMGALKASRQPLVALGILTALGLVPEVLKERILEALAANASVVLTNVHGADRPRYLGGQRIASQMFWVPQSGGISLGLSLLSYASQVSFGVVADAGRVPDPAELAALFRSQFEALLLATLMQPWPVPACAAPAAPEDGPAP